MTTWVGTSGWSYDHWSGVLYPPGLPPRDRLARYVESFDTVELNASYYRWPGVPSFASWRRRLPDGFRMTVKAPRGLTHARKLAAPEAWVERILAGWVALDDRRGMLLVQLPPAWRATTTASTTSCRCCRRGVRPRWSSGTTPGWRIRCSSCWSAAARRTS